MCFSLAVIGPLVPSSTAFTLTKAATGHRTPPRLRAPTIDDQFIAQQKIKNAKKERNARENMRKAQTVNPCQLGARTMLDYTCGQRGSSKSLSDAQQNPPSKPTHALERSRVSVPRNPAHDSMKPIPRRPAKRFADEKPAEEESPISFPESSKIRASVPSGVKTSEEDGFQELLSDLRVVIDTEGDIDSCDNGSKKDRSSSPPDVHQSPTASTPSNPPSTNANSQKSHETDRYASGSESNPRSSSDSESQPDYPKRPSSLLAPFMNLMTAKDFGVSSSSSPLVLVTSSRDIRPLSASDVLPEDDRKDTDKNSDKGKSVSTRKSTQLSPVDSGSSSSSPISRTSPKLFLRKKIFPAMRRCSDARKSVHRRLPAKSTASTARPIGAKGSSSSIPKFVTREMSLAERCKGDAIHKPYGVILALCAASLSLLVSKKLFLAFQARCQENCRCDFVPLAKSQHVRTLSLQIWTPDQSILALFAF